MNKIYRTVWNECTKTWVAASELVKGKGKSNTVVLNSEHITSINHCRGLGLVKLGLIAGLIQLQFCTSLTFAANLAISGGSNQSTSGTGSTYSLGSHGSVVFAGDDDYCGADKVIGRNQKTNGISALAEYLNFANNVTKNGRHAYGTSDHQVTYTGSGTTSDSQIGYMGAPTGGDTNARPTAFGVYSFATGCGAYAIGNYSVAFGANATALGGGAMAFGVAALASSPASIALGISSQATGTSAVAVGAIANAQGEGAVALGLNAQAIGSNADNPATEDDKDPFSSSDKIAHSATAIGNSALANGSSATALGNLARASASSALAVGYAAQATVDNGIALGSKAVAETVAGISGYDAATGDISANTNNSWKSTAAALSIGDVKNGITRQINGVAAGSADTDAVNVAQLQGLRNSVSTGLSNADTNITHLQTDLATTNTTVGSLQSDLNSTKDNVNDLSTELNASNDKVNTLQTNLNTTNSNISKLSTNLNESNNKITDLQNNTLKWNDQLNAYDASHGNVKAEKISHVAAGTIAADSTDAINGSQLFSTNSSISQLSVSTSTSLNDLANSLSTVTGSQLQQMSENISTLKQNSLQWSDDLGAYDAGRNNSSQKISHVAAGTVAADSNEAVNGSQLFSLSTSTVNDISKLSNNLDNTNNTISNLSSSISTSNSQLSQLTNQISSSVSTVQSSLSETNSNLAHLQTSVSTGLTSMSTGLNSMHSNLHTLDTHVSVLTNSTSTAVNYLSSNLTTTNSQLTQLAEQTTDRLSTLQSNLAENDHQLDNLQTTVTRNTNSLSTGLNSTNSNLASLSTLTVNNLTSINNSLSTTNINVATLQQNTLQWNSDLGSYDAAHNTDQAQKITHVAAGSIAADSTDAINGSQLYELSSSISTSASNNLSATNINIANLQQNALQWNDKLKAYDAAREGSSQKLTHVAAGSIANDSSDAINGSQIFSLSTSITSSLTNLNTDLQNTHTTVNSLSTSITDVNKALTSTNSQLSSLSVSTSTGLNNLNNYVDQTNTDLTSLSTSTVQNLDKINHNLDDTKNQLATTTANLDHVSSSLSTVNTNLEQFTQQTTSDLHSINNDLSSLSTSTAGNISNLNTELATANSNLSSLSTMTASSLTNFNTSLSTTVKAVNGLQQNALQWNSNIGGYDAARSNGHAGRIINVANGLLAADSQDAVNGSQLYQLSTSTQAGFSSLSTSVQSLNSELTSAVNTDLGNLSTAIHNNNSNIAALQQNALQWRDKLEAYDAAYDHQDQKITHLAAGDVQADSSDAINGTQFYTLSTSTQNTFNNLTSSLSTATNTIDSLNTSLGTTITKMAQLSDSTSTSINNLNTNLTHARDDIGLLQQNALQWNNQLQSFDASYHNQATKITHVADGSVTKDSSDAVNGGQLYSLSTTAQNWVSSLSTGLSNTDNNLDQLSTSTLTGLSTLRNDLLTTTNNLNDLQQNTLQWNEHIQAYDALHNDVAQKITHVAAGEISPDSTDAVNGSQLQTTNSRLNSLADILGMGQNNSGVFGHRNVVDGEGSHTLGNNNDLGDAEQSIAIGNNNKIDKLSTGKILNNVHIMGNYAHVSADNVLSLGNHTYVSGENGLALGNNTLVTADAGLALGLNAQVVAVNGLALGTNAKVNDINGLALGANARTNQADGIALGSESVASTAAGIIGYGIDSQSNLSAVWQSSRAAVSIGDANNGITRQIKGVAAGSDDSDAVNVAQLKTVSSNLSASLNDSITNSVSTSLSTTNSHLSQLQENALQWNGRIYDAQNRMISHVGAGSISADSTDAINGSQLYTVQSTLQHGLDVATGRIDSLSTSMVAPPSEEMATLAQLTSLSTSLSTAISTTNSALINSLGGQSQFQQQDSNRTSPLATADSNGFIPPQFTTTNATGELVTANNVADALTNLYQGGVRGVHVNSTQDSVAKGTEAMAIGGSASASGNHSIAIGANASTATNADNAVAIGANASASQSGGVALGSGSVASVGAGVKGYVPVNATQQQAKAIEATQSTQAAVAVGNADTGTYRQITGLAAGTNDSDAVNVAQLKGVNNQISQVKQYVNNIDNRINRVERKAYSGTALALALSGAYLPTLNAGEQTVGIGVGSYQGYAAIGLNYKAMNSHGNVSWGAGISSTSNEFGVNAGVGFKW